MIDYDCPCGGRAVYKGNPPGGRVECRICNYSGPHRVDPDEARADWNSQVADWARRNKGTEDVFTAVSLLRPEAERAALKGLAVWDDTSNLEKAFAAVRLHLELVVQELNEWKLLDTLEWEAQRRVQAEIYLRESSRRAEAEMYTATELAEMSAEGYSTEGQEPGFSLDRSLANNVIPPPWFPQATTSLPLNQRSATEEPLKDLPPVYIGETVANKPRKIDSAPTQQSKNPRGRRVIKQRGVN